MRIVLASAPHRDSFGYSMPPPGLLRLGGELLRRGIDVRLEDLAYRLATGEIGGRDGMCADAARLLLRSGAPEVLGLSTMGATLPAALLIAKQVRLLAPDTRILLGGPGTHGLDRVLIERFDDVDVVVRGEGEQTLPELIERLSGGRDLAGVRGLTWRDCSGVPRREDDRAPIADLTQLADYARSLLPPLSDYKKITGAEDGLIPIDSGRGCVYDCSFCTIGRYWGRRSRPLPVKQLVREVLSIREIEGARSAYLCHDIFGADRAHALEFCDAMIELGAPVPWECRARIDHIDEDLARRMGRAGCYRVLFGIESGDAALRNQHDKHMAPNLDLPARIEACVRAGVMPILSIILGLPGEGEESLAASMELAAAVGLAGGVQISFHLVNPQPGCELGTKFANDSHSVAGIPPDMAMGAGETKPERALIDAHPDLFSTWSLLTSLPGGEQHLRALHRIAKRVPDVLMRYPRCFLAHCRGSGESAIEVIRRWESSGHSFEDFTAAEGDPLLSDVLRWEQAIAAAPQRLRVRFEPAELTAWLRGKLPAAPPVRSTQLAVLATARGTLTLKISADVARLMDQHGDQEESWRALAQHTNAS